MYSKFIFLCLILILSSSAAGATINISEPMADDVFTEDFPVTLFIDDPTISNINIRLEGNEWIPLSSNDQSGTKEWTKMFNTSSYPNGNYILNAKYKNNIGYIFTDNKVPITIRKTIILGNISIHIEDSRGHAIPDVLVTPGDIRSDSSGNIKLTNLDLQTYNFSFTKPDYNTTYLPQTFTSNVLISKNIVMKKTTELKEFVVAGYDYLEAGTTNIILVTDMDTGERVDRTEVFLNDAKNEEYGPFVSMNGRVSIDLTSAQGGSYYIQVNKNGYKTWSEDIFVRSPRITPTPSPTPTPAPTPVPTKEPFPTQYYPDAKDYLTPQEYKDWQLKQVAQILVSSDVKGADVFIDGVNKGTTNSVLEVSTTPGVHNIRLSLTGYTDEIGTVTALPGQQVTYTAQLKSNSQTNPLFYLAILVIFGFVLYRSFGGVIRTGINKILYKAGIIKNPIEETGDDADVQKELHINRDVQDEVDFFVLKCDRCNDWEKRIPKDASRTKIKEYMQLLDSHIEEFHQEQVEVETQGKNKLNKDSGENDGGS